MVKVENSYFASVFANEISDGQDSEIFDYFKFSCTTSEGEKNK